MSTASASTSAAAADLLHVPEDNFPVLEDAVGLQHQNSRAFAIDLAAGTISGVAQLLVGHPLDTVKVRMQTQYTAGTLDAARRIISQGGPLALYRGMGPPLITIAAYNALLFSSMGVVNRLIRPDGGVMTSSEAALAGALSGIPVTFLSGPTELFKCRLQEQGAKKPPPGVVYTHADAHAGRVLYRGPVDAFRKVLQFEGVPGVFRGLGATFLREIPGNAAYFACYSWLKHVMAGPGGDVRALSPQALMLAGGIAGVAFWVPVLPIDTIKTRIQTDSPFQPKYRGVIDCARQLYRAEGWRGMVRGWQPCVARSIPANAAMFVAYEVAHAKLTTLTAVATIE